MAQVFAENVIEIVFEHTLQGRPCFNVLHVVNDEGAQSDLTKVTDVRDNWQDHIIGRAGSDLVLQRVTWMSLDPDDSNMGELAPNAAKPVAGASGADVLPPNSALHIRKLTDGRQRGQRNGRIFLAGVPKGMVDDLGNLQGGYVSASQPEIDAFLDGVNDDQFGVGGGSGLVVLNTTPASRLKGGPPVTLTHRPVTSLVLDPKVASQRDRLR